MHTAYQTYTKKSNSNSTQLFRSTPTALPLSIQIATNPFYLSFKTSYDDDANIKTELQTHYKQNKSSIDLQHVQAHHDNKIELKYLSLASKINVQMDSRAKLALQKPTKIKYRRMTPHLSFKKVSIKSKYDRITNDIYNNMNRYKIGHKYEPWLARR